MTFARHDVFDIICKIIFMKQNQILCLHEVTDRHTLINQMCHCVGIIRCGNNRTILLPCQDLDGLRHLGISTENNTSGIHLYGTDLCLITVPQNDHIIRFYVCFHNFRAGSCHNYFSLFKISFFIPDIKCSVQCLKNILVLCSCLGQNRTVNDCHIGSGNIADTDQTFQHIIICYNRKGCTLRLI